MENADTYSLMMGATQEIGISLPGIKIQEFVTYMAELKAWNEKMNLTALRTDRDIVLKHFIDSLTPMRFIPKGSYVLDIGSGGGFPGIPLKIVEPSLCVILVDANRKKVHFLRHIIRKLGLQSISAEQVFLDKNLARAPRFYERADVVISRAFSDLGTFLDLAVYLLKPGGHAIAMKGKEAQKEIDLSSGGQGGQFVLTDNLEIALPFVNDSRRIVRFRKS